MASFSVGQCVVLQFTPDPWSVRITITWCARAHLRGVLRPVVENSGFELAPV